MESSGLRFVKQELKVRMDCIDVDICTRCSTLAIVHSCGKSDGLVKASIPKSKIVLDLTNLVTNGYITKYQLHY